MRSGFFGMLRVGIDYGRGEAPICDGGWKPTLVSARSLCERATSGTCFGRRRDSSSGFCGGRGKSRATPNPEINRQSATSACLKFVLAKNGQFYFYLTPHIGKVLWCIAMIDL
jgi:hypothetical protein